MPAADPGAREPGCVRRSTAIVGRPSRAVRARVGCRAVPRAALFITCFNDTLFPGGGRSTVALLERLGVDVDFPEAQTCCGQMHSNSGYQLEAVPLARR